jgi:hypothetical protein
MLFLRFWVPERDFWGPRYCLLSAQNRVVRANSKTTYSRRGELSEDMRWGLKELLRVIDRPWERRKLGYRSKDSGAGQTLAPGECWDPLKP